MSKTYKNPKKYRDEEYRERYVRKLDKKKRAKELREKRKHTHGLVE